MTILKNIFTPLLIVALSLNVAVAQGDFDPVKFEESLKNASFKDKLEAANALMEDQLYVYAVKVLINLVAEQPDNANINYKIGICYINISNDRAKALPYLLNAEKKISKNYDPFTTFETNAPIETYFYLGKAYHITNDCDKATENFNKFISQSSKKHILYAKAEVSIKQCVIAKGEFADPKEHKIANIGPEINGPDDDFSPVVTLDEGAMFFTSRRMRPDSSNITKFSQQDGKHFEDVYISYKDFKTGKWLEPEVLTNISSINSNQASISVSADGQQLFIYRDIKGNGEIYVAEYEGHHLWNTKRYGEFCKFTKLGNSWYSFC
jgi:tetratricopeptide (TPR) repeat protein